MTAPIKQRPWLEVTVTARRRKKGEASKAKIRVQADDGLKVQCPRDWRADMGNGVAYVVTAALRADGTCYVVKPSHGYRLAGAA